MSDIGKATAAGVAWILSTQIQREELRRAVQFASVVGGVYFSARALRKLAAGVPILGEVVLGGPVEDSGEALPVPKPNQEWKIPLPGIVPKLPPPPTLPPMVGELLLGSKSSQLIGRIVDPPYGGSVSRPLFGSSVELSLELANWGGVMGSGLVDVTLDWQGIAGAGVARATFGPFEVDGRSSIRVPVKVGLGGTPFSPWIPKPVTCSVTVNGIVTQVTSFEVH